MASEEGEYMFGYTARPKRSRACHTCKKRKGRCEGGIPCRWCQSHNLKCSTIAEPDGGSKKKKRDDTRSTVLLNTRELGLLTDAEVSRYIDLYLKACMIDMTHGGAIVRHLQNPKTYSDFFIKYATCAMSARATGDVTRASNIMNEARSFARQSYDDMSMESLAGFVMLSLYWLGIDINVMKHYGAIGVSILETIPRNRVPTHLGYVSVLHKNIFASDRCYEEKMKLLAAGIKDITIASPSAAFVAGEMRILMKLLCQTSSFTLTSCRPDLLAVMLCQLSFTETQRDAVIREMRELSDIGLQYVNPLPVFILNFLEVFVTWRSGNAKRAAEMAVDLSQMATKENFMFASRFEMDFLFSLAILCYDSYPAVANKFYSLAEHISTLVCTPSNLSQSSEHLASFISELLPIEPQPPPPTSTTSKPRAPRTPSPPAAHTRMIDGLMALAHRFVPPTNTCALMSLEGLHTMHTTFMRLCPPLCSRYNPLIHLPNHHYISKVPAITGSSVPIALSPSPSPSTSPPSIIPISAPVSIPTSTTSSPQINYSPMILQSSILTSAANQFNVLATNYSNLTLNSSNPLHTAYQTLAYQFNPIVNHTHPERLMERTNSNSSNSTCSSPATTPSPSVLSPYSPTPNDSTPPVTPPIPISKPTPVPPHAINTTIYYQPPLTNLPAAQFNMPQQSPSTLFNTPSFSPTTTLPSPVYIQSNNMYSIPFSPVYGLTDPNTSLQNFMNITSTPFIPMTTSNPDNNILFENFADLEYINSLNNYVATVNQNFQDCSISQPQSRIIIEEIDNNGCDQFQGTTM